MERTDIVIVGGGIAGISRLISHAPLAHALLHDRLTMNRHIRARAFLVFLCFAAPTTLTACAGSHGLDPPDAGGPSDAPSVSDAPPAVDVDAAVSCEGPAPLARACSADLDCTMAFHFADCCGTGEWVGVRVDGEAAFAAQVIACEPLEPLCDCAARPTNADDGTSTATPGATLHVNCVGGACRTSYRGDR